MTALSSPSMSRCRDALLHPSLRQEPPIERTDISIARFADHAQAEQVIKALAQAGVDMKQMSIVAVADITAKRMSLAFTTPANGSGSGENTAPSGAVFGVSSGQEYSSFRR